MQRSIIPEQLDKLASEINKEHRQCESAAHSAVSHAINAGTLLIEAKAQCPHGTWQQWLAANFEGSVRTAQAYMRLAREWPELTDPNAQSSAHLNIDAALKALSDKSFLSAVEPESIQRIPDDPAPVNEPEHMYDGDDDIAQFRTEPEPRKRMVTPSAPPEYVCETCGEISDRPMWHCDGCDEHYPRTQRFCPDCNPPEPTAPDERQPYEFELLEDARYTLAEARDLLGTDTSAGGMVNGLIRNLDDVVKNIRRWRGEMV